jgi:hypothetical protein
MNFENVRITVSVICRQLKTSLSSLASFIKICPIRGYVYRCNKFTLRISDLKSDRLDQGREISKFKVKGSSQTRAQQMINRGRLKPHIGPKPDHSKGTLSIA